MAVTQVLVSLDCWTAEETAKLTTFQHRPLENWRKFKVGELRAVS